MKALSDVVGASRVVVVCGSGGVGKTTTAAAIGLLAATHSARRVLVMTVDPARRLADALHVERIGNHAVGIDPGALEAACGTPPQGSLSAAMLDTKQSWDDLVRRHAPDETTRDRILGNPLYANITGRFVQSHDYIAMERLHEVVESGDWDLVVIDTPPVSHAVDFLEAPARMADFFDSRLLKFLVAPSRSKVLNLTARPFLQLADRILGKRFLADISELFGLLETMRPGFIERARSVEALLAEPTTTFAVVTTLEHAARAEAASFLDELRRRGLGVGALVLNRTLPRDLVRSEDGGAIGGAVQSAARAVAAALGEDPAQVERVLRSATENLERMELLARQEEAERAALAEVPEVLVAAPRFGHELGDLSGLARLGGTIWW